MCPCRARAAISTALCECEKQRDPIWASAGACAAAAGWTSCSNAVQDALLRPYMVSKRGLSGLGGVKNVAVFRFSFSFVFCKKTAHNAHNFRGVIHHEVKVPTIDDASVLEH